MLPPIPREGAFSPPGNSAAVFAALGDDVRLGLVEKLSAAGPQSITGLTAGVGITRQAVTKHLHVLEMAGLVNGSRRGREQFWELLPEQLDWARSYLDLVSSRWDDALARLARHLEQEE
jgi:DNA-binding transcriptional ArsR family regulator